MTNKYDILEEMLEKLFEHEAELENILAEFPDHADELRPLLEAALNAEKIAPEVVPDDLARRGRTRLLQQAAQMRNATPTTRGSFLSLRFATVALGLILVFFVSGTGLVQASASALPGDGLYPVKIGWEQAHFWFADSAKVASLQVKYEEERREEVNTLLGYRRMAAVQFEGVIFSQNGSMWNVAGVPVNVSDDTDVEASIGVGSDVIVSGETQLDGVVLAKKIVLSHPEDETSLPTATKDAMNADEPDDENGEDEIETPEQELEDEEDMDFRENDHSSTPRSGDGDKDKDTEAPEPDDDDEPEADESPEPDGDDEEDE